MPVTKVRSKWVNGNLVFTDSAGNTIVTFDGTNRKLTIHEADATILKKGGNAIVNAATNAKLNQVVLSNDVAVYDEDGAISTAGIALITGATGISGLTLGAPAPGARVEIRLEAISSGTVVVTCDEGVTFDGTNDIATFDTAGEYLILVYGHENEWSIVDSDGVALSESA